MIGSDCLRNCHNQRPTEEPDPQPPLHKDASQTWGVCMQLPGRESRSNSGQDRPDGRGGGGGGEMGLAETYGPVAVAGLTLWSPWMGSTARSANIDLPVSNGAHPGPCFGGRTPPLCDIPLGKCFFTGPWTVTRSSLRVLRRVAVF